jgi:DinB superfamily
MAPEQEIEIIKTLEKSREDLHSAVEGIAEAEARTKPAEGRWSVLECLEHVATVERRFLGRLESAGWLESAIDPQREAGVLAMVTDRSQRRQAPDVVQPSGRFATLAEALADFDSTRAQVIQFAEARHTELRTLAAQHPLFGQVNGYELMLIIAGHACRHAAQIREARATLAGA